MAMPCKNLPSKVLQTTKQISAFLLIPVIQFDHDARPSTKLFIAKNLMSDTQDYRIGKLADGLIETGTPCGCSRVMSGILILEVSTVTLLVTAFGWIFLAISRKLLISPHL
jgi:hypothetical protein